MDYEQILFETRGRVGIITLNRPNRLNAWSAVMNHEVRDAIEMCNKNQAIGAIVITGAGRAYCSGADLSGPIGAGDANAKPAPPPSTESWLEFLARNAKPTIAAINGAAVGFGITHTLAFDIRIASELAQVGFPFAKLGLVNEVASSYFLPQMVGFGRAMEWCLSGRLVPADEAHAAGLFSEVVAATALLDRAVEIAEQAALAPPALALVKQLLRQNATETDLDLVLQREIDALAKARSAWESKEAMAAFLEKRPPDYTKEPATALSETESADVF